MSDEKDDEPKRRKRKKKKASIAAKPKGHRLGDINAHQWRCVVCTFVNQGDLCTQCKQPRPSEPDDNGHDSDEDDDDVVVVGHSTAAPMRQRQASRTMDNDLPESDEEDVHEKKKLASSRANVKARPDTSARNKPASTARGGSQMKAAGGGSRSKTMTVPRGGSGIQTAPATKAAAKKSTSGGNKIHSLFD